MVTQVSPNWMSSDQYSQDVGKGLFIAVTTVLVIAALILAFGSAASL
jgi:hypothetical protein